MPQQQVQVTTIDPDSLGVTVSGNGTSEVLITLANGQQVQVSAGAGQQVQVTQQQVQV